MRKSILYGFLNAITMKKLSNKKSFNYEHEIGDTVFIYQSGKIYKCVVMGFIYCIDSKRGISERDKIYSTLSFSYILEHPCYKESLKVSDVDVFSSKEDLKKYLIEKVEKL